MDTAISQEQLKKVFDRMTREITRKVVGLQLTLVETPSENDPPGDDLCTVYVVFKRGFSFGLSLRTDMALLTRLAQSFLQKEELNSMEVEEAAKEYFNVLCGRMAITLFRITRIASRFGVPAFYRESYSPQGFSEQFVLSYSGEQHESVQLVCYAPASDVEDEKSAN